MAETKAEWIGLTEWDRLYLRIQSKPGVSKYRAWGNGIEFRGEILGYRKEVLQLLRRMVIAKAEPPDVVVKTAKLLFEHIEAYLRHDHIFGDDFIGTAVDYEDPESPYRSFTLYIEAVTQHIDIMDHIVTDKGEDLGRAEHGWLVNIMATYEGYDGGNGEGKHMVKRKLVFNGRIDADLLWRELLTTVRRAVNALPWEEEVDE
jgi:hypothetical protein